MNQTKLHPYQRSVSIVGVSCTPFMYTVDNPETNGLTEGEMFGYAALKAMEDAGVSPKDVDYYFHGEASPMNASNYITPNVQVANWFGMKGKGSMHTTKLTPAFEVRLYTLYRQKQSRDIFKDHVLRKMGAKS